MGKSKPKKTISPSAKATALPAAKATSAKPTGIRRRLGHRVAALRMRRGWAQVDLAAESDLHRTYISKIETGSIEIGLTTLEVLAKSFGMSVSQLMRGV